MAYSTWKRRPSGEKVLTPLSYSERVRYMMLVGFYLFVVSGSAALGLDGCGCGFSWKFRLSSP
jgi:hypothetical protein